MATPISLKRMAKVLFLGLQVAAFPIRVEITTELGVTFGDTIAHAKNGDGDGGGDGDGNDNSGSGKSDDDGSDNSGPGNSDDDDHDDDDHDDDSDSEDRRDVGRVDARNNIALKYSNGWRERIENGRYILIDPRGRTVADRWATPKDLRRMRDLIKN